MMSTYYEARQEDLAFARTVARAKVDAYVTRYAPYIEIEPIERSCVQVRLDELNADKGAN